MTACRMLIRCRQVASEAIETGLDGSGFGCSVATVVFTDAEQRKDPLFGLLFASSVLVLLLRRLGIFNNKSKPFV